MNQVSYNEVLSQINQLPLPEQEKLLETLSAKLSRSGKPKRDKQVKPLLPQADFTVEMQWLREHGAEYAGRWVALKGSRLVAQGGSAKEVYAAAEAVGVEMPLVARVDDPNAPPFAGV